MVVEAAVMITAVLKAAKVDWIEKAQRAVGMHDKLSLAFSSSVD